LIEGDSTAVEFLGGLLVALARPDEHSISDVAQWGSQESFYQGFHGGVSCSKGALQGGEISKETWKIKESWACAVSDSTLIVCTRPSSSNLSGGEFLRQL
jgi:hypothetical protein